MTRGGSKALGEERIEAASDETFEVSNGPNFADKLEAIFGPYLNPLEHALVLSVDEKSQIQALDRIQRGLPPKKVWVATTSHDYKRKGTMTLFAALNTRGGEVMGTDTQKHRYQEWLRVLKQIHSGNATRQTSAYHLLQLRHA